MSAADDIVTLAATTLLQGPLYALDKPRAWQALRQYTPRVRELITLLGAKIVIDDTEEYAYLVLRDDLPDEVPRLLQRRPLSHGATVMLAMLRQAMLHKEMQEAVDRYVFTGDQIIEMTRPMHPESMSDETIRNTLTRLAELGYIRRIRGSQDDWEALRIIKAHVNADWVAANVEKLRTIARGENTPSDIDDADRFDLTVHASTSTLTFSEDVRSAPVPDGSNSAEEEMAAS